MDNYKRSFMCLENIYWERYNNGKYEKREFVKGKVYHWYEIGISNFTGITFAKHFQEITPTEENLRKAVNILDEKFVGNYGYILNSKMFYKYDGKGDWLKNNICAKQYEICEKYYDAGYNIDPECCEICKKADKVPDEEKFYYEYGYYESEDDTEPEIYLSEEEYHILELLEKENG